MRGATSNSHSWADRPAADDERRPGMRAGFTEVLVTDADQVYEGQTQTMPRQRR